MPKRFSYLPTVVRVDLDRHTGSPFISRDCPRLSWVSHSPVADWEQAESTIRLGLNGVDTEHVLIGTQSVDVAWPFEPLRPRDAVTIQVQVRGADGRASQWSEPIHRTAGFLAPGEWTAEFLSDGPGPTRFTTVFDVDRPLRRATLYATALGVFAVDVNDRPASEDVLAPGWTPYRQRLNHETWDVTSLVARGTNTLALTVAGGWYTESYGFGDNHAEYYDDVTSVSALLLLEFADRTSRWVRTNDEWLASSVGPLLSSGIYAGEQFDARRQWSSWNAATPSTIGVVPSMRTGPVVRRHEALPVKEVIITPSGATVLDFGQNLVGRVRFTSRGRPGDATTLHHAEVLEHGELAIGPLRRARAVDRYVHGGEGPEVWEPDFTFHGFRYVQVDGVDDLRPDDYRAIVLHSEMRRTGHFASSDPLLNQLHDNIVWSMRGNMLALPTDCPQRDERLGWTGDVQVFAPTASFLYDCDAFLASWLEDLVLEQRAAGGIVPVVVPWVLDWKPTEVAAWGDAATVVPWVLHERFGDRSLLERQASSMRSWADRLIARAAGSGLVEGGFQFGDWLDPTAPPDQPDRAATSADLVASAWYIRSLDLVAATEALGGVAAEAYSVEAQRARASFRARHLRSRGRLSSDAPTAYALAVAFDLIPDATIALGARLAQLVRKADHRIATGFVGTPLLLDALTMTGHFDDAVELLLQRECPSWLYPVTMGATTVWERWDSMRPDGSINPGEMTSFNHYALGSVADWMHRTLAGLAPLEPGYRTLRIAPRVTQRLDSARAELDTPYGLAVSGWARESDGEIRVACTIPTGARAAVELPDGRLFEVGSGAHQWTL